MSPSPFVVEWAAQVARALDAAGTPAHTVARRTSGERRRLLDIAMGRGRHATLLALAGFHTFGVDVNLDALREAAARATEAGVTVHPWCADLTQHPLPAAWFDVVVVTRYLQRDLFPALQRAVRPGGYVLYETFTTAQRALGIGPTSPDHLLEPGELRARFEVSGWESLFYEETIEPEAVARLVARRSG